MIMKTTKHITLLMVCLSLSTLTGFGQDKTPVRNKVVKALLPKYDLNKNGKIDENEQAAILKAYDTNEDGTLSKSEKRSLAQSVTRAAAPQEKPTEGPWSASGFVRANTLGGGAAEVRKDGVFRVFVLMGQSNMAGAGEASKLKPPYTEKHERIRIFANGRWEYLVPSARFGPEVSFAHQLAEHWPEDTIGIIKVAVGGTGICGFEKNWSEQRAQRTADAKKGPLYQQLMQAVAKANEISTPVYSGFVWKQGGADGRRKDLAEEYYDTFKQLVADLRKDLAVPELPTVVLTYLNDEKLDKAHKEMAGNKQAAKRAHLIQVLKAHNRAGRDIPNTVTVHHGALPLVDAVHFNHEGQITLGKMAADAVEKVDQAKKPADGKTLPKER